MWGHRSFIFGFRSLSPNHSAEYTLQDGLRALTHTSSFLRETVESIGFNVEKTKEPPSM